MPSKHKQIVPGKTRNKRRIGLVGLSSASALITAMLVAPGADAGPNPSNLVVTTKTVVKPIKSPVVSTKSPKMYAGQRKVIARGSAGKAVLTLNLHLRNGKVRHRQVINRVVLKEPTATHVVVGTKAAPVGNIGKWNRIAQCESGGNWRINTGNGYYGGLQFLASTWRAHGGKGMPHHASKMEQIRIAERVRKASGGYGAWGSCGRR
ncbi:MAG TPA: resuscitation-promoting factor [Marmoricola sp.]|nr:resuscitation-promoting factor [Marmoricola sp.]HNI70729.1 resuscitation-promoting factor [Marmoricola sp.]HNJ79383.1 resuscitation-promoting factor [Marmoricola sp.]HNO40471.1 resuscitation-promoting factor [Marmoricola sp.]